MQMATSAVENDPARRTFSALHSYLRDELRLDGLVALHEPRFEDNAWNYVKDCLDSGWVSSVGAWVDRFETMCAEAADVPFAVATVNGTAALHMAFHALGIGAGDLVVCPPLTFVATANAIRYCNAHPVFVDVDDSTMGLDPLRLEDFLEHECERVSHGLVHRATGKRVAAVVAMHVFGNPVQAETLSAVCERFGLPLVEDAAEALGSRRRGRPCGSLAHVSTLSFNGNKLVTTGGGGMILTADEHLARRVRHLTTTARIAAGWEFAHDDLGWNYRLPNLNAALGCAQMERLSDLLAAKRRLNRHYYNLFHGIEGVSVLTDLPGSEGNHWLNAVVMPNKVQRDTLLTLSNDAGLQCRPAWRLMHRLPHLSTCPIAAAGLFQAENWVERLVNIPSSPFLAPPEVAA